MALPRRNPFQTPLHKKLLTTFYLVPAGGTRQEVAKSPENQRKNTKTPGIQNRRVEVLHRPSHHPQGRERNPNPNLSPPHPKQTQLSHRDKKKMDRTMTLSSPGNQIQNPKNPSFLVKATSKIPPHHTEPRPDNVKSRINTYRPIKEIKDSRCVGKRHLRRPHCTDNSSPKSTNGRGGDVRSFSSMKASRKILTTSHSPKLT